MARGRSTEVFIPASSPVSRGAARRICKAAGGRQDDLLDGPGFLPQLRDGIGEDLLCFAAERDGQRTASVAVVRFGNVGWVSWLGFAQHDRPNDFTYSNLVYYHLAESAAKLGINTLLYGNSVLKAKEMRGCKIRVN